MLDVLIQLIIFKVKCWHVNAKSTRNWDYTSLQRGKKNAQRTCAKSSDYMSIITCAKITCLRFERTWRDVCWDAHKTLHQSKVSTISDTFLNVNENPFDQNIFQQWTTSVISFSLMVRNTVHTKTITIYDFFFFFFRKREHVCQFISNSYSMKMYQFSAKLRPA